MYHKKPQKKLYENFPGLVEINMLFQHVKQAMQECRQGGLGGLSSSRFFRKYKALAYSFSYFFVNCIIMMCIIVVW